METQRKKSKANPKKVRRILIIIALVLVGLAALVVTLRSRVKEKYASKDDSDISTATVERGSISTSVSGSGMLSDDDVEDIEIPSGVELNIIHVRRGDTVEEGELIASVNLNTVLTAMSELNEEIEELDDEIVDAADETVSSTVSSTVKGRVKQVFAEKGESVIGVMGENGALCVLSMDGTLSFELSSEGYAIGDSLSVSVDGSSYTGTVTAIDEGSISVSVTDNGPLVGATATAYAADGSELGSGELSISAPLKIVGYAGTVSAVHATENKQVAVGSSLFTLTDTAYTANYETLLKQRQDKEAELQQLVEIYRSGGIFAPFSGTVKSIDAVEGTPDEEDDGTLPTQSFSISPDATMSLSLSIDESEILSISVGQSAVVTMDSIENESFTGTVTSIDRVGTSSSGVTVYTADIEIEKQSGMLSGMSADATITIEGVDNVLLIPVDALQKTRTGYYVYTSQDEDGNLGGMVEITIGISNSNYVEISSGLSEGDTVYYTEKADDFFSMFSGGGFSGGNMPSGGGFSGGGSMPSGGGSGGGNMPGGGGSMPSGGPSRG